MSLKHINKKIKLFYHKYIKTVFWLWIVILGLINSYILGYLSNYNLEKDPIEIHHDPNIEITIAELNKKNLDDTEKGIIVASKNGAKYYFIHCGGVNRINEENKIYFSSEEEAVNDGYELAVNCKK